jgi:hypothetical protein
VDLYRAAIIAKCESRALLVAEGDEMVALTLGLM